MALFHAPTTRASVPARFGDACDGRGVRAAGHASRGVGRASTVHCAPLGERAPTYHGALVQKQEGLRDRARQDVAPGAPMDGFMAFAEALLLLRRCAATQSARVRREARP
jgi:hypothetical protein